VYTGQMAAAVREGVAADSSQSQNAQYYRHQLARIYILNGEQEKALDVRVILSEAKEPCVGAWLLRFAQDDSDRSG